ncbi:alpha/beta hydrolase [Lactobacillus sp. ESL0785]|uniref:alpha/beta hydrolase n=1 Tax=Lactobacillus sp. ESL0785 TaxID=2983232 RepID=UPI0023F76A8D|nr:alpha/beta hydrolase [Lactobacillus sp. ESL0785]WEV70483.1 alpha/beta hydrolase [Lactobacillus sp. ESL0785]
MQIKKFNLNKNNPDVTLTAYLLDDSHEMLKGTPRPALIICPGGGYFSCSDREAEPVAMYFANQGYHTFVLRYTTYAKGSLAMPDLSKPLPEKKESQYPKQIRELGQSMLLIRKNAEKWHIDSKRIGVCGFSAGGHVAALYSTVFNEPVLTDYLGATAKELRPAATILGYAITDYHLLDQDVKAKKNSPMDYAFMKASNVAFLGQEFPDEETEWKVSPVDHVDTDTPPFFIWTTATDPLVTPINSLNLAKVLAEHKVPYEIHIFGEGGHGLSLGTQAVAEAKSQINPKVGQWTTLCTKWLEKYFALDLPEKSDFEKMQEKIK